MKLSTPVTFKKNLADLYGHFKTENFFFYQGFPEALFDKFKKWQILLKKKTFLFEVILLFQSYMIILNQ